MDRSSANTGKNADALLCDIAQSLGVGCLSDVPLLRNTYAFNLAVKRVNVDDYSLDAWREAVVYICSKPASCIMTKTAARDMMIKH